MRSPMQTAWSPPICAGNAESPAQVCIALFLSRSSLLPHAARGPKAKLDIRLRDAQRPTSHSAIRPPALDIHIRAGRIH